MDTPDDASAPPNILDKKQKEGPMVSNGWSAKIDLFQSRKAPIVLSLKPSAELFVFKMGPVAGPCHPDRPHNAKHEPYSMEGPLVPEVGPLELRGS